MDVADVMFHVVVILFVDFTPGHTRDCITIIECLLFCDRVCACGWRTRADGMLPYR